MPAYAEDNITIYVNEQILQYDVAPYIENGRTMVPMRKIFDALDAKADWEGTTQTITATKGDIEIILQINNTTMKNNGVDEALDVAPVIVGSYTFVSIRAVSQSLKADVEWLGHNQSVYINSPELFKQASESITKTGTMYACDGKIIIVSQDEVYAYQNVGWYETQAQAQATNKVTNTSSGLSNPSSDGYYYRTPTGKNITCIQTVAEKQP